jgi:hypothetical protein
MISELSRKNMIEKLEESSFFRTEKRPNGRSPLKKALIYFVMWS